MNHPLAQLAFKVSLVLAISGVAGAALAALVGLVLGAVLPAAPAAASPTTRVCGPNDTMPAGSPEYVAQNNVWGADTRQCVSVGDKFLQVDEAEHDKPPNGAPAASPALLKGCHWGTCTADSGLPVQVATMPRVTSDLSTAQIDSGVYNAAYALWFHSKPATDGPPDGAELVVWLSSHGGVRPSGSVVASGVPLSGATWDVWFEQAEGRNRVVYERKGEVDIVKGLDVRAFAQDSVARGYVRPEWYLIGVEAGFNLWRGGAGNTIDSFSVALDDSAPPALPSRSPAPRGGAACTAVLQVDASWQGGFTASVVVTNSGDRRVRGWTVEWVFPDGQQIQNAWNANVTQNGATVQAVNADYNGALEVAGSTSFGMQGTGAPPNGVVVNCTVV